MDADDLAEALAQAHNALHAGDVDGCHEILHQALGSGYVSGKERLTGTDPWTFDERFRALCIDLNVRASYVLVTDTGRTLTGGEADVDRMVNAALAPRPNRAARRSKGRNP
jgi:hypothetical protein